MEKKTDNISPEIIEKLNESLTNGTTYSNDGIVVIPHDHTIKESVALLLNESKGDDRCKKYMAAKAMMESIVADITKDYVK